MLEIRKIFTLTISLDIIKTASQDELNSHKINRLDGESEHDEEESLISMNEGFYNLNINERSFQDIESIELHSGEDLLLNPQQDLNLFQAPPSNAEEEAGSKLLDPYNHRYADSGIEDQSLLLQIPVTDDNPGSLFPVEGSDSLNTCDYSFREQTEPSFDAETQAISNAESCYVPLNEVKQNEYGNMDVAGALAPNYSPLETKLHEMDEKKGAKKKTKKKSKSIPIPKEEEKRSRYEADPKFMEIKNALELALKTAQVNKALEERYEDFNTLYQGHLTLSKGVDEVIEILDRKLLSIPSIANKIRISCQGNPTVLNISLGVLLANLGEETEFIKGNFERAIAQRFALSNIIVDIREVESMGGGK